MNMYRLKNPYSNQNTKDSLRVLCGILNDKGNNCSTQLALIDYENLYELRSDQHTYGNNHSPIFHRNFWGKKIPYLRCDIVVEGDSVTITSAQQLFRISLEEIGIEATMEHTPS